MDKRQEIEDMKVYLGLKELKESSDEDDGAKGFPIVAESTLSPEEEQEYLKLKNSVNLNKIRKGVTFFVVLAVISLCISVVSFLVAL